MPQMEDIYLLRPMPYSQSKFLRRLTYLLIVFTVLIALLFTVSFYMNNTKYAKPLAKSRPACPIVKYDYSLLALRWIPTTCTDTKCVADKEKWEIHGLWPTYFNGSWPQFCCDTSPFNVNLIEALIPEMDTVWQNQMPDKSNDSLWAHEWNKHGTCSKIGIENGQKSYFVKTLDLFNKYPIQEWLNKAGIIPTTRSNKNAYELNKVHEAIESQIGHKINLHCTRKSDMIDTLYLCFDYLNLALIDCPQKDSCAEKVILPKLNA